MKTFSFVIFITLCILSCKKKVDKTVDIPQLTTVKNTIKNGKKDLSNFRIFDLYTLENTGKYDLFISLSDIYNDSTAVPNDIIENQKSKTFAELQHIELTGIYREKLLKGTSLSEMDALYLYNYKEAKLQKFPIRDLKSVANLNLYASEGEEISYYDYMIGFQLNESKNSDEIASNKSDYSLAYFGKESPFSAEKLVPIHWKKTRRENFPLSLKNEQNLGETYLAKFEDFIYYIQDHQDDYGIGKRDFAVVQGKKIIFTKTFKKGEGAEFSPLNFIDNIEYNDGQWTGRLFKNKPPVVFGFVSESFGCESITFLDSSYPTLYVDCDNRH